MIRARISIGKDGCLRGFEASGHAGKASAGYDIVCSAFSCLARTAFKALGKLPGTEARGAAAAPGELSFEIIRPAASAERAAGIADFLVTGLSDLAREYPGLVLIEIERDVEE